MTNDKSNTELADLVRRFAEAECSWLHYTGVSMRPIAVPVWHVWHEGCIVIGTQAKTTKVRSIRRDPRVTVHLPDPMEVAIFEGDATVYEGPSLREIVPGLRPHFLEKYDWDIALDDDASEDGDFESFRAILSIAPTRLVAWGSSGSAKRTIWSASDLAALGDL